MGLLEEGKMLFRTVSIDLLSMESRKAQEYLKMSHQRQQDLLQEQRHREQKSPVPYARFQKLPVSASTVRSTLSSSGKFKYEKRQH